MASSDVWLNILKVSPTPIAVFGLSDNSYSLLFASTAYLELFGIQEAEILNKSVSDIFLSQGIHVKDDFIPAMVQSMQKAVESGLPDRISNVEMSFHYKNAAIPETLYIDVDNTPVEEDGVVKYVSQTISYHQIPGTIFQAIMPDFPMINGIVDNFRDVTERREAELEKNLLINNTEESFVLLNMDLEIVSFNDQFEKLYKNYFNKVVEKGQSILTYSQPERVSVVSEIYSRVLQGESERSEITVTDPSSQEKKVFSIKFKPAINSQGEIIGAFVTATDITERQLALEKLTESEERYKLLFQLAPHPKFVYDLANFQIVDVNETATAHYSYTRYEFLSKSILDITAEDEKERFVEIHKHIQLSERVVNFGIFVHLKKNGGLIKSDISGYKISYGSRDCMMTSCNDVTERENAFQRIKENESKLLASQKIAKVGYWQSFPDSKELYWSDEVYNIWGLDKQTFNLNYESHFNTIHPEDREEFLRSRDRAFKDGVQHDVEHRIILPDGSIKWVHTLGNLIKNDQGKSMIFEGTAQDITERKNLELLLEKSNSLAEIGSWEIDIRNNSVYWSSITKQIHEVDGDYKPDVETAINFYQEGYHRDSIRKAVEQSLNHGTAWDMELQIVTNKGNERWVRAIGETEFINGKCVKLYGSLQNITHRKIAEIELLKIYDEKNTILESIQDGFFALDKNWTITYWNHEAENLLSLKRSEALNKNIWEVFEDTVELKFHSEFNRAVDNKVPVRFEEYFAPLNRWLEVSAFPSDDGLTVYFRDVTSRKDIELELLQFKKIIDNSRDGIAIVDMEGKITYLNPAFSSAIGYNPLIHDHPESIYSNPKFIGQVFDTLLSGKYWQGDVEIKTRTGEPISYYLSGGPVFDDQGQLKAVYGIHTDITERKQAEQKLRKAYHERNTILESIGDGFFAVDKTWIVNYWNREAEKLLGKTKKQMMGNHLWKVFANMTESTSYSKYQEAIDTNLVVHFEDYYPDMHKWYEVSAYPSVDGLSVFFKDISERKISEIQLKDLNLVLRNKVKELAISNRELEEFAYVASHDLQEPLRMISSFLTQLQRKYNDQLDLKAHQYINFAVDGAKRMRQIILDLLDFSRVGRGDAEIESVNLNEVINEILILFRKNIEETKTVFVVSDMPSINIPKASIRQLMQNLISNAIKYQTPENSPLIEIGFTEASEQWQFWVKDNGIGISPDYFDKIFIIFQRLHTKEQYSGTGLGLAICRKIVENLGGKLWIESEEGKGSTFFFTVPKLIKSE